MFAGQACLVYRDKLNIAILLLGIYYDGNAEAILRGLIQ